jgi:hypothetical protein
MIFPVWTALSSEEVEYATTINVFLLIDASGQHEKVEL